MSFMGFILSLVFLAMALSLLVVLSWLMISPVLHILRRKKGGRPIRKADTKLKKIDSLIEKGKHDDALKLLRKGFVIKSPSDPKGIEKLRDLHQNLLSRVLVIIEERQGRAEAIAEVEHAMLQRIELLYLLSKAHDSFHNIRSRREKAGKELPSWSKSDFESRIKEIQLELKANEQALNDSLITLFDAAKTQNKETEPIVYH